MSITRRAAAAALTAITAVTTLAALTAAPGAFAQGFPSRPLTMIAPFAAGGTNDSIARAAARLMEPELGQPVVVANRVGAGGTVGVAAVLTPPLDGHNLIMAGMGSIVLAPVIHKDRIKYDTQRDLTPIGVLGSVPIVIAVKSGLPVQTLAELLALAKSKPGQITYGSPGLGGSMHVAGSLLEKETGIQLNHVPYKGGAPAMTDLAAGTIDAAVTDVTLIKPHLQSGRVRVLAILGSQRSAQMPTVPTTAELGWPKVRLDTWYAVFAASATPPASLAKLREAFERARAKPEMATLLQAQGVTPVTMPVKAFEDALKQDFTSWQPLVTQICSAAGCD